MRKIAVVALVLVCCCVCLCGCSEDKRTVHFVVDDQTYEIIEQSGNNTVIPSAHPEKHGYIFDGWYLDKDVWQNQVTTEFHAGKFENDAKIYAKWTPKNYRVTYNLNGGINSQDNPNEYNIESKDITLQSPTKHNAVFVGWFEGDKKVNGISKGSTGDRLFVAKWLDYDYIVNYDNNKTAEQNGNMLVEVFSTAKDSSVVLVEDGTYFVGSSLTLDKSLTVIGQSADNTVI